MGMSWWVYNFECADGAAREALMAEIEANHPVEFPDETYSVFEAVETSDGERAADYAWIDRYLYVSVMADAENLVHETVDHWDRAAWAFMEATTETAQDVTFVLDKGMGEDDEAGAVQFDGLEGWAGLDVMYALAMEHGFRFRSYSAQSPTNQMTPHPAALDSPLDVVGDVPGFVAEMEATMGVERSAQGWELFYADVAEEMDLEYGETHGPEDPEEGGLDAVMVYDVASGHLAEYESPEDVPEADDEHQQWLNDRYRSHLGG